MRNDLHHSTPEEIEARRDEVAAAECRGDGIHTSDMRFWHDWLLWSRKPYSLEGSEFDESAYFALADRPSAEWREVWYCTRCRKFEQRTVAL